MRRELKARIDNIDKTEKGLLSLGAEYLNAKTSKYTYFNQPEGKVLKLTESGGKTYRTVMELHEGKFEIISSDLLADEWGVRDEFESKFGVKKELTNHRRFFALGNSTISINKIEGVGDFLIIEAENPTPEILHELGIKKDAIAIDSFDNL